jgi:aldehyde dehydrogenase (NAD+)
VETSTNEYIDKYDPRTSRKQKEVASSRPQDVDTAIAAAAASLTTRRDMRLSERGRILVEIARAVRNSAGRIGDIERSETGTPGREMAQLIDLTARYLEFYGGIANTMDGEVINVGLNYHVYTCRDPFGVAGVILPWNAPLHPAARAIAPALATGNTIVAKPSKSASPRKPHPSTR